MYLFECIKTSQCYNLTRRCSHLPMWSDFLIYLFWEFPYLFILSNLCFTSAKFTMHRRIKTNFILNFETRLILDFSYNSSTGVFTADSAGLYFFSSYLASDSSGDYENFHLHKNDEEQCRLLVEGVKDDDVYITTTCSVTVEMSPGDQVYVACDTTNGLNVGDINGFTGFRI